MIKIAVLGLHPHHQDQALTGPLSVHKNLFRHLFSHGQDIEWTFLSVYNTQRTLTKVLSEIDRFEVPVQYVGFWTAYQILLRGDYDIIHFLGLGGRLVSPIMILQRVLGFKCIYTVHGIAKIEREMSYPHKFHTLLLEKWMVSRASVITAVSENLRKMILREFPGSQQSRVEVIENGIDDFFFDSPVQFDFRQQIGLEPEAKLILTAGGTEERKGIQFVFDAIELLDVGNCVLVNIGPKGSRHREVIRLIEKLDVEFHSLGLQSQFVLKAAYQAADLFVHPAKYEPFGIAPLEAMSCACPTVISDRVGMRYAINNGVNGFIVPYGNTRQLAEIISTLLQDSEARARIGIEAQRTAKSFHWSKIAQRYIDFYRSL